MAEYFVVFLLLFLIAFVFYIGYDRVFRKPAEPRENVYLEALRDLLEGRQESAFTKLRQVVTEDPNNLDAYLRLGRILRDNNQPGRALQVHKDLTLHSGLTRSDKVAILQQIAADCLSLDDRKMAEDALKELLSLDSNHLWGHTQLLKLQEKDNRWVEAYDTAVKILHLESNKSKKPLAHYKFQAGEQLFRQREYHKARIFYKEAIGLDPSLVKGYLAIGDSYREEGRLEDAVTFWQKLISAVPDQGHLVIDRLQKVLFDLGRFGDIREICESILNHAPKNLEARLALAEFYAKKGDTDLAIDLYDRVVDDFPAHMPTVLELIRMYLEQGDSGKISSLLKTLERKQQAHAEGAPASSSMESPLPL
jgi:lipopolysaccharide biosynthesis regulator YciM